MRETDIHICCFSTSLFRNAIVRCLQYTNMFEKSTPVPTAACTAGSAAIHDVPRVTNKPPSVAVTRLCSPVWASEDHSVAGRSVAAPDLLHSLHRRFSRLCSQMQLPPAPAALQALHPCSQMEIPPVPAALHSLQQRQQQQHHDNVVLWNVISQILFEHKQTHASELGTK